MKQVMMKIPRGMLIVTPIILVAVISAWIAILMVAGGGSDVAYRCRLDQSGRRVRRHGLGVLQGSSWTLAVTRRRKRRETAQHANQALGPSSALLGRCSITHR